MNEETLTVAAEPAHHPLGNSSAGRRYLCPASLRMEEGLPEEQTKEAKEGVDYHWIFERATMLELEGMPWRDNIEDPTCELDLDLIGRVIESRRPYFDETKWKVFPETCMRIVDPDTSEVLTFGTVDFLAVSEEHFFLQDTKTGWGSFDRVSAEFQAGMGYVEACQRFGPRPVTVEFFPRFGAPYRAEWTPDIIQTIIATWKMVRDDCYGDKWVFKPSASACQFCRAKSVCPAFEKTLRGMVARTEEMSPDSLRRKEEFLTYWSALEKTVAKWKEELKAAIPVGGQSELFSHLSRRGREFFPNPNSAYQLLKDFIRPLEWFELCGSPKVNDVVKRATERYMQHNPESTKKDATAAVKDLLEDEIARSASTTYLRRR